MKIRTVLNTVSLVFSALAFLSLAIHALTFLGYDLRISFVWYGLQFSSALALILGLLIFGVNQKITPLPSNW